MADGQSNGVPVPDSTKQELVDDVVHEASIAVPVVYTDDGKPTTTRELASRLHHLSLSAQSIHADDFLNSHQAVAPPMHVSTTFRYSNNPDELKLWVNVNPANPHDSHMYSRDTAPNSLRFETVLTSILNGPALSYSSGLSAFHALLVFLNPKRIAIGDGYHGCHGVIALLSKLTGLTTVPLSADFETELRPGDVVHVETPLNPTGEARDLASFAERARKAGCWLCVDATFAPPPLMDPFVLGADVVMHSGTKYFGGHSDMLSGVLAVNPKHADWIEKLRAERLVLGSVMGSFEGWLGVRSLRTLEIRVRKQSRDAEELVTWLAGQARQGGEVDDLVLEVKHASLQKADLESGWLRKQMPNGFGPVFAVYMRDQEDARRFPSKLELFHHATSLGGVESLVEWRAMTDATVDKRLLRFSIGLEGFEDLRDDLVKGFEALRKEKKSRGTGGANVVGGI
ncbi:PLP-dependent transferase [Annulohypoxylon maeteangense]|uniref:PLP-dependent transferase n=1 Tax=Annulohypoxylon maeteangense TaxID=1927788 RepID=UPI0020076282|nr:PLP-dependent transferase [Annulohypoxylon maeteangense]KAI0889822.1 PLP-dependent transferase [Annulohypoxylon maeteangense]